MDWSLPSRINNSLSKAMRMCPEYAAAFKYYDYYNETVGLNLDTEFPEIMCEAARLMLIGINVNINLSLVYFYVVPIGIVGCFVALAILSTSHCREVTFSYHRAINAADTVAVATFLQQALFRWYYDVASRNQFWMYLNALVTPQIERTLSMFVEFLIAWISVERALCYLPALFNRVNQPHVARGMIISTLLLSTVLSVPMDLQFYISYFEGTGQYQILPTTLSGSVHFARYVTFYNTLGTMRAGALVLGTIATLVVLIVAAKKKRYLAKSIGPNTPSGARLLSQAKTNQMLCLMQLCEALPVVVRCALVLVMRTINLYIGFEIFVPLSYNDAKSLAANLDMKLRVIYAKNSLDAIVHALHVFLYLLFLRKIRTIVLNFFKRAFRTGAEATSITVHPTEQLQHRQLNLL